MNNWKFGLALIAAVAILAAVLLYNDSACHVGGGDVRMGSVLVIGRC